MADPDVYVNMPDSPLPSALPKGWTVSHPADPLTVVGPERDLTISYFSGLPGGSVDEQVRSAWRQLDPEFDKPVRHQADMPSTEGWDRVIQIVYDMPANESRLAVAIVRIARRASLYQFNRWRQGRLQSPPGADFGDQQSVEACRFTRAQPCRDEAEVLW